MAEANFAPAMAAMLLARPALQGQAGFTNGTLSRVGWIKIDVYAQKYWWTCVHVASRSAAHVVTPAALPAAKAKARSKSRNRPNKAGATPPDPEPAAPRAPEAPWIKSQAPAEATADPPQPSLSSAPSWLFSSVVIKAPRHPVKTMSLVCLVVGFLYAFINFNYETVKKYFVPWSHAMGFFLEKHV